jgi:SSS family solute:Na+ symporter
VIPAVLDAEAPYWVEGVGPNRVARGRSIAVVNAGGISDQIIPMYITTAMPRWFGLIFLLTLLSAAMSTLSSQFHTVGTAAGRDVYQRLVGVRGGGGADRTIYIVRIAILVGLVLAVAIGYYAKKEQFVVSIIARATAIFFGLCASTFLPAFLGAIFWKRMTRAGALASMVMGFAVTVLWLVFVKVPECGLIGVVKTSVLAGAPNWPVVDSLLIALPISGVTAVVVSLFTKPPDAVHLAKCFPEQATASSRNRKERG